MKKRKLHKIFNFSKSLETFYKKEEEKTKGQNAYCSLLWKPLKPSRVVYYVHTYVLAGQGTEKNGQKRATVT